MGAAKSKCIHGIPSFCGFVDFVKLADRYFVTVDGCVYSTYHTKIKKLKPFVNKKGYELIHLHDEKGVVYERMISKTNTNTNNFDGSNCITAMDLQRILLHI